MNDPVNSKGSRFGIVIIVLLLAAGGVVAGYFLFQPGESPEGSPVVNPSTSPADGSPQPSGPPSFYVAISRQPDVVRVDLDTGERKLIAGETEMGQGGEGIALSADRKFVYFSRILTGCISEIVRVPATGGPVEVVTRGASPAASPDGKKLAFSVPGNPESSCTFNAIGVRDLGTGEEVVWGPGQPETTDPEDVRSKPMHIGSLSWAPNARELAFDRSWEDYFETRILDTSREGVVMDGRLLAPPQSSWGVPAYRGATGLLGLAIACCYPEEEPTSVYSVDPISEKSSELFGLTGPVRSLAFDPTGKELLLVSGDAGRLFRWKEGGSLDQIGTAFSAVTW